LSYIGIAPFPNLSRPVTMNLWTALLFKLSLLVEWYFKKSPFQYFWHTFLHSLYTNYQYIYRYYRMTNDTQHNHNG